MAGRGNTEIQNRFFAALPYILPLVYVVPFGAFLFRQFPIISIIYLPLQPVLAIYRFPFAGLIVFFVLILAVVRNENIPHFIRFNTMQAILIDILLILIRFATQILNLGGGGGLLIQTLFNTIFIGTLAIVVYGIVQSARGIYAEIPAISEAVHGQVR
ncbi:hypothetical protein FRE64_05655 [Euhalothece natronophila Z-M001]|uniref:DUF4870 domain-containing protein n=1 Tax=Euhalothece natronophila Z-M001 TaxID=522448 RepID=A0A5B8NK66_9CHRO|nr:Tic20 family protein [Euhalothece natronophila]QDZ39454.1 hypothetical protein FRE64_05655 [Euhalothece natronophila Z-M001]